MTDTSSFRSAFNGFNREDVVSYISGILEKLTASDKANAELQAVLEQKTGEYDSLYNERNALAQELSVLKAQYASLEQACKTLLDKNEELNDRCAEYAKTAYANELKLGAAMLDAKRFSEMLVKEANDRAGDVYQNAYDSVSRSTESAREIDEKMQALTVDFEQSMGELRRNMGKLIGSMTSFSDSAKDKGAKFLYDSGFSGEEA